MRTHKVKRFSIILLGVFFLFALGIATVLAPYQYTFYGLYSESGTYSGSTDVTVYFDNDTSTSFTVNVSSGYSIYFPGNANNMVDCGNVTIPTGSFTLGFWCMYPSGSTKYGAVGRVHLGGGFTDADSSYWLLFRPGTGSSRGFRASIDNGTALLNCDYSGGFSAGTWHYGVMVFDTATTVLSSYFDGVLHDSLTTGWTQVNQNYTAVDDFQMGRYSWNEEVTAYYDEVVFYDRALDATEILQLYNEGYGRYDLVDSTSLIAYWHLDEGAGNTTADASGNGWNGNLTNGATWGAGHVDDVIVQIYDNLPVGFEWNVSYVNVSRYFIPTGDAVEVFWLFDLDAIGEDYLFTVYAYQALLPAWLETARHVNDTERLIERRTINATQNQVPMVMVTGATYFVQIRGSDGTTYDFGIFVPGSNDPTLRLNPIGFSSRIQMAYRYLQVEGTRNSTNERITVSSNDELNETTWIDLEIQYKNGTIAWESNTTYPGPTIQFQWNNADNTTNYIGVLEISHTSFGNMSHQMSFPLNPSYGQPFNLTFLGTTPADFPQSDLISIGIMFSVAAVFSTVTAPIGGFMIVLTAATLYQLRWVNWSTDLMIMAMALVVMFTVHRARRGG